jgi:hypothetical protein
MFGWFKKKAVVTESIIQTEPVICWNKCDYLSYFDASRVFIEAEIEAFDTYAKNGFLNELGLQPARMIVYKADEIQKLKELSKDPNIQFLTKAEAEKIVKDYNMFSGYTPLFVGKIPTNVTNNLLKQKAFIKKHCSKFAYFEKAADRGVAKPHEDWVEIPITSYKNYEYIRAYKKEPRLGIIGDKREFKDYTYINPTNNARVILLPVINDVFVCLDYWQGERKQKIQDFLESDEI